MVLLGEVLASRFSTVSKKSKNTHRCKDADKMSFRGTVQDRASSAVPTSLKPFDVAAGCVDRLVAHANGNDAEHLPRDRSCESSNLGPDLGECEIQTRSRAESAPSQLQGSGRSVSDWETCQPRNRFRTVCAISQLSPCERQVNSILNKLTRERFEHLYQQMLGICRSEGFDYEVIRVVARGVFAKATVQHSFAEMYAEMCLKLYTDFAAHATRLGVDVEFKQCLVEQCQNSFEAYLQPPSIDGSSSGDEQFEQLTKYKTKMLGNVRLIAYLIRQTILSSEIIFDCTGELLRVGSVETLESLCTFVSTLGDFFYAPEWHANAQLLALLNRIRQLSEDSTQNSRIRVLLKNVLDNHSTSPLESTEVKPGPVLLGRPVSVRGGSVPTRVATKHKPSKKSKDVSFKQAEHSIFHGEASKEKVKHSETKAVQEICLSVALELESAPVKATASDSQPAIVNLKQDEMAEAVPKTTLMLRNIPVEFTRDTVIDFLRSEGFGDHIRFVYVPMNLRSIGNFGYCFVDFDSMIIAERCQDQLRGFTRWSVPCDKALEFAWSDTQGIDAQIGRYRDSPLMHESVVDEMKPALFENGARVAFPPPTKSIRAPRMRKVVESGEPSQ